MSVPRLGQGHDSDSTNNSESTSTVAGLDVLLQLLQNTNASNVASIPQSDNLELSRTHSHENAVQAAATALNQLSQQEAPDTQSPIAAMLQSVRPSSPMSYLLPEICAVSTVSRICDANATL
jgi:transcription-repair coupling factor (superfamily II helicase)